MKKSWNILILGTGQIASHLLSMILLKHELTKYQCKINLYLLGSCEKRSLGMLMDWEDAHEAYFQKQDPNERMLHLELLPDKDLLKIDILVSCYGTSLPETVSSRNDLIEPHIEKLNSFSPLCSQMFDKDTLLINIVNPIEQMTNIICHKLNIQKSRALGIGMRHDNARARIVSGDNNIEVYGVHGDTVTYPYSSDKLSKAINKRSIDILKYKGNRPPVLAPTSSLFIVLDSLIVEGLYKGWASGFEESSNNFQGGKIRFCQDKGLISLKSEVPMKNCYDFLSNAEVLSSFVLNNTPLLERVYRFYSDEDEMVWFIKQLFYRADGIDLDVSKSTKKLGFYLDEASCRSFLSEDISNSVPHKKIWSSYENYLIKFKTKEKKLLEARKIFLDSKVDTKNILNELSKEISLLKSLLNKVEDRYKSKEKVSQIHFLKEKIREASKSLQGREKKDTIQKLKQQVEQIKESFMDDIPEDQIEYVSTLKSQLSTLQEKKKSVPERVKRERETTWSKIEDIFNSLEHKLPITRASRYLDQYIDSYLAFHRPLGRDEFAFLLDKWSSILTSRSYSAITPREILTSFYSKKYFLVADFYHILDVKDKDMLDKLYFKRSIPPLCATRLSRSSTDSALLPDCGESSLRNVLNILLWDRNQSKFRPEWLSNVHPKLLSYYSHSNDISSALSQKSHNEWLKVCADMDNVTYLYPASAPREELAPSYENMMILITALTGKSFDDFVDSVNIHRSEKIKVVKDVVDGLIELTLKVSDDVVKWKFLERHFRTIEDRNYLATDNTIVQTEDERSILWRCAFYAQGCESTVVENELLPKVSLSPSTFLLLLNSKLEYIEDIEKFVIKMLITKSYKKYPNTIQTLNLLTRYIPDNDDHGHRIKNIHNTAKSIGINLSN